MNLSQIEKRLQEIVEYFNQFEFIYDLLGAYNLPKASITRLRKGNLNLSKNQGEIIWKKKLFFREEMMLDLHESITTIQDNHKHNERFIIVTDYETFLAIDIKTGDRLDIQLKDLPKHYDFFLPWAGMEKTQHANENPADVKAAEKMAKLFDAIKQNNPDDSEEFTHSLNVFLSRLLFCFFAEDTNIFGENQFTNSISSHTQTDGSDLDVYLESLFDVLNTPEAERDGLPAYLEAFPYVNGGLFEDKLPVPKLNRKSRQSIIESGELNWSDINPDIFGSMFQAVIHIDQRGSLGQHYTSVPNIMKVIEPLFLNELYEEFEKTKGNKERLQALLRRLQNIKIFDPACGSGNFLIIAYKELRRLEIKILNELKGINETFGSGSLDFGADYYSHISLNNFYGIEIDDFAHEIAKLALWLAEHQLNQEFYHAFGKSNPTLPLKAAGQIIKGNACRIDWNDVCPKTENSETFILGNPPYLGFNVQDDFQKEDLALTYPDSSDMKYLDYIVCWFIKASSYIDDRSSFAFVTTNSLCQGAQVPKIWPHILRDENEIHFAFPEFVWSNNAKKKAGVICSIVGVRKKSSKPKYIYHGGNKLAASNINPYLINGGNTLVQKRQKVLADFSPMNTGNIPYDGGNLILSEEEKDGLVRKHPDASKFIKELSGSREFINNLTRYCIWIEDGDVDEAMQIPDIRKRISLVRESRLSGGKIARNYADVPHRFYMTNRPGQSQLIVPRVSSIRREYIPIGFLTSDVIIADSAQAIFDPETFLFSVLNSRMHMIWVRTVAGRLKSDFRYSAILCYNTFPFPQISNQKKEELERSALRILDEREKFSEMSLAELYDPMKMPAELQDAHRQNDELVERCYRSSSFRNDEERLEYLFLLYEKMIIQEQNAQTLFEKQRKLRTKK